jgi:hypothetical protein
MKVVVRDHSWNFAMNYVRCKNFNAKVFGQVGSLEYDLLKIVCEKINVKFVYVLQQKILKWEKISNNLIIYVYA